MNSFARLLTAILCCILPAAVYAQTAPDGNDRQKTQMIAADSERIESPFGRPDMKSDGNMQAKYDFSKALNLAAFRELSVFHNGRVKVLDTLARESVGTLCGRKDYFDVTDKGDKLKFDPMFTMLDLMIDPAYYADRPVLGIGYLPLRRSILELEFPKDPAKLEYWLKSTRVSPVMFRKHSPLVAQKHGMEAPYNDALMRADSAVRLWDSGWANLIVIPPVTADKPWQHISTVASDSPVRSAALKLGTAWRAKDASAAQAALDEISALLPAFKTDSYPGSSRHLEVVYNQSRPFEWGWVAYGISFVLLLLAFGTARKSILNLGLAMLLVAMAIHIAGFVIRSYLAQRYAIQNQFESMTGISLFGAIVGLVIMLITRRPLFGAAAAGLGFIALIGATQTSIPGYAIEREAAILNTSVLLKYHVTTVLVSYALITLGMLISCFYLVAHYSAKSKGTLPAMALAGGTMGDSTEPSDDEPATAGTIARSLSDLDKAQMIVLQLAFWTLGVGILLGGWWADHSWGRWWAFDPKETWALITWIIYLILIHVRITTGKNRALLTAWLSLAGFITMLWCYFGVNLILPGLHAYA